MNFSLSVQEFLGKTMSAKGQGLGCVPVLCPDGGEIEQMHQDEEKLSECFQSLLLAERAGK